MPYAADIIGKLKTHVLYLALYCLWPCRTFGDVNYMVSCTAQPLEFVSTLAHMQALTESHKMMLGDAVAALWDTVDRKCIFTEKIRQLEIQQNLDWATLVAIISGSKHVIVACSYGISA